MSDLLPAAGDLRGAAILSAAFVSLLLIAEAWRRFGSPQPEHTRKLVHLGGGIVCLLFPFLVRSPLVVLAMAVPLTALFAAGGRLGFLQSLHGVGRPSRGVEYYPLAVFLAFLLARDRPWLYLAAVLVLAVGDAFAALVGGRYGRIRYEVEDETKSLEGSLVFLVIAFLAIHLPVLLLTDLPRPVTVLAALLVAVLVTGFEAVSLQGADNLFVPLAVVVILAKITSKPLGEVIFQNLSLAAICLLAALVVWRFRSFNVGGAIAFVLFAYGTWSLGSWQWALPVFTGFFAYALVWFRRSPAAPGVKTRTVARALLVPFLLLALANGTGDYGGWFAPYLAACGAVLALALPASRQRQPARRLARAAGAALAAWALIALPPWLLPESARWTSLAAIGAAILAVALANALLDRADPEGARSRQWTARRFLLPLLAAALVALLQQTPHVPPWEPGWTVELEWRRV